MCQTKLASDVGPVTSDVLGVHSDPILCIARLLDAGALRKAIKRYRANLGVVVSPSSSKPRSASLAGRSTRLALTGLRSRQGNQPVCMDEAHRSGVARNWARRLFSNAPPSAGNCLAVSPALITAAGLTGGQLPGRPAGRPAGNVNPGFRSCSVRKPHALRPVSSARARTGRRRAAGGRCRPSRPEPSAGRWSPSRNGS